MQDASDSVDNGGDRRSNRIVMEASRRLSGDFTDWDRELLNSLKEDIKCYSPPSASAVEHSHILMLGPVGAGKSSFYNTIAAMFSGHITIHAPSGSAEQSLTSRYRAYKLRCADSETPLNFRLCDTRGLEEDRGIDREDVRAILDGKIKDNHLFQDSPFKKAKRIFWTTWHVLTFIWRWILYLCILLWNMFDEHAYLNPRPVRPRFSHPVPLKDKIHCVCMLIDGSTASVLPNKMTEKIKAIKGLVSDEGIPFLIIMTKLDKLCEEVDEDISKAFSSKTIQDQVNTVSQIFGVPRNHVLLVKNYEKEYTLNVNVSILALRALRIILGAANDYMNGQLQD